MTLTRLPLFVWAQISTRSCSWWLAAPWLLQWSCSRWTVSSPRTFHDPGSARTVPAPLLVLRAPGGLHHDPAGVRDDLRIIPVFSKKPLLVTGQWSRRYSPLFSCRWRSGPTTFSVGMNIYVETFFMVMTMLIWGSHRDQVLQLDSHDLVRCR
jgi:hypothetical protein